MNNGRIVYSTGKSDFSIASRVGAKIDEYSSQGKVYESGVILMDWQTRGWRSGYKADTRRQGKSRAGHYTTKLG
ncbi:MAG: hypothetical protein ACYC27_03050 [Armatimonadota bacterium]